MQAKQQYIVMRNKNRFNTEWFHKYWLDNGGRAMSLNEFEQHFFYEAVLNELGDVIGKTLKNIAPLLNNMDKKFNLTILLNNKGQFLKVVV